MQRASAYHQTKNTELATRECRAAMARPRCRAKSQIWQSARLYRAKCATAPMPHEIIMSRHRRNVGGVLVGGFQPRLRGALVRPRYFSARRRMRRYRASALAALLRAGVVNGIAGFCEIGSASALIVKASILAMRSLTQRAMPSSIKSGQSEISQRRLMGTSQASAC